ncbi:carbon-nitrogen hydrolase family protein [Lutispora saccharofermentans]|uniref:Carbon-nitrogen hydrolase family protein n=1 Tax=Lutispora saccharofermentans TaxID=3024236 RepID=A0ABT1NF34_9FIRM|nr:carbon-nitrogen hydrolase family protein [Lutispora saccharofermentans]MCQ1529674.1 carbon-nitrogen hydrolase family protein [Lutispora saccharofermentans]
MRNVKAGICQMQVELDKSMNLQKAENMIREAAGNGSNIVILPEMFNCPYDTKYFSAFAEAYPGDTASMLSHLAKELGIYIIGGSVPEKDGDAVYNTSYSFDRDGKLIGKHRKMHLFDIDVEGGVRFKESDVLGYGQEATVFDTEYCKIGVAICYDMRFPELMRLMCKAGAEIIVIPAAFNLTTGPAHWEITVRTRALDNQVYFIAASSSRNLDFTYHAYGHSCIANPWGAIIKEADEKECILYGELDLDMVQKVRKELPLLKHLRNDIYEVCKK